MVPRPGITKGGLTYGIGGIKARGNSSPSTQIGKPLMRNCKALPSNGNGAAINGQKCGPNGVKEIKSIVFKICPGNQTPSFLKVSNNTQRKIAGIQGVKSINCELRALHYDLFNIIKMQ